MFSSRSASEGRLANDDDNGRAAFTWLLGAGVVLLAGAFLVRGYLRRRSFA